MGYSKGHYGKYTGNAKWSMDHAHTRVDKKNYKYYFDKPIVIKDKSTLSLQSISQILQ